jgi:hypothetical protein
MKRFFVLILLSSILLIKAEAQTSKIIFYRNCHFFGAALAPNLYLNDTLITKMKHQTFKVIKIPSKTVEFYSYLSPTFFNRSNIMTKLKLHLVPNSVYFVNVSLEGMNDQIRPSFKLVNRDQLKELAKRSKLRDDLKQNNINIDDVNISYVDTIISRNKRIKLLYDPSLWIYYSNLPENIKWNSYFESNDESTVVYTSESNLTIADKDIENVVKDQVNNYVVKKISYKKDSINNLPITDVAITAEYAGINYQMREYIYSSKEGSYFLLTITKMKNYEKSKCLIDKLFSGVQKY